MRLPTHPGVWFSGFTIWFIVLWWLSSGVRETPEVLDFRASDKVLHFGWFLGGAGLLSAALFTRNPEGSDRKRILVTVIVVFLVAVLDEYHQSLVPGRHGNDPYDLSADLLGAIAGAMIFRPFRRFLRN